MAPLAGASAARLRVPATSALKSVRTSARAVQARVRCARPLGCPGNGLRSRCGAVALRSKSHALGGRTLRVSAKADGDAAGSASSSSVQTSSSAVDFERVRFASALSQEMTLSAAVEECLATAEEQLQGASPDLAIVMVSSAFSNEMSELVPLLQGRCPSLHSVIGCTGFGVIGRDVNYQPGANNDGDDITAGTGLTPQEIEGMSLQGGGNYEKSPMVEVEQRPALSISLACLPGVKVRTFTLDTEDVPDADEPPKAWHDVTGVPMPTSAEEPTPHFVLFGEPGFTKLPDVLAGLDFAFPSSTKIGGLASASPLHSGAPVMVCTLARDAFSRKTEYVYRKGMVGLALQGSNIHLEGIVSQGCRPIGGTYRITQANANVILEVEDLDGLTRSSPLEALTRDVNSMPAEDRPLVQTSLTCALAGSVLKEELDTADFLVRGLLAIDSRVGAVAVGEQVHVGQCMRYMVRDRKGSAQDLEVKLQDFKRRQLDTTLLGEDLQPVGALLFSCNGRGKGLYNVENFDSAMIHKYLPVDGGGFFSNGEIGPVGDSTYIHGFTMVAGIIKARNPRPAAEESHEEL